VQIQYAYFIGRAKGIASTMSSEWLEVVDFNDIMCHMEEKKGYL